MTAKPTINSTVWDQLESLENEEPGFLMELLETFAVATPISLEKLETAWAQKDLKGVGRAAHSLKSSCQALGGTSAGEALSAVETTVVRAPDTLTPAMVQEAVEQVRGLIVEFGARKTALQLKRVG